MKEFKTKINDIKSCIRVLQKKKTNEVINNLILVFSTLYLILMYVIAKEVNNLSLLDTAVIVPIVSIIYTSISSCVYNIRFIRSQSNLSLLLSELDKRNINTCIKNLKDSIIITDRKIDVFNLRKDNRRVKSIGISHEDTILFLDNSSNIKGILKKDTLEILDSDILDEIRDYYILDDREVEDVVDNVEKRKIKKLVRKK